MKLLWVTSYFYPETTSFSGLERDLLKGFISKEFDLIIVCPTPSRGVLEKHPQSDANDKEMNEILQNITIKRFWAPKERKSVLGRAIRYLWCNILQYFASVGVKNVDVIFCHSTPPTQGFICGLLKRRLKCSFVYSLQDIFPDSMIAAGLLRESSWLWRISKVLERKTYASADKIIVISKSFREILVDRDVPFSKITLIPNWIDTDDVRPVERSENRLIEILNLEPTDFIVTYAKSFGSAQGAEVLLDVAERVSKYKNIKLVIFGEGSLFEEVKSEAVIRKIDNVTWSKVMPKDFVSEVYSLGDVSLVIGKAGLGRSSLPSKIWSIMSCGTQVIASFDMESDLAKVILEANAGHCVPPGDVEKVVQLIEKRHEAWRGKKTINSFARDYTVRYASRSHCVKSYVNCILDSRYL